MVGRAKGAAALQLTPTGTKELEDTEEGRGVGGEGGKEVGTGTRRSQRKALEGDGEPGN